MLTALLIIPLIGSIALLPIAEGTAAGDSRDPTNCPSNING